ncbi:PREDICTED: catalase-2-like isoform X5 [Tarenaya hassleriana]|uniref:catalase-2-like isoform X5 n=1 Tax=Tarenaya hassleriana TaxID=28532 RepID=UPI0008FD6CDF|nr:PREDICTED: catalase-2-like isoform X5 [Tarenaya hassleriana]
MFREYTIQMTSSSKLVYSPTPTQRHRLGPNYVQLLVNAPKYAHHNHHHVVKVNYFTSRYDPVRHAERYPIPPAICSGRRERCIIEKENSFEQLGREIPFFHAPDRFLQSLSLNATTTNNVRFLLIPEILPTHTKPLSLIRSNRLISCWDRSWGAV